MSKSIRAVRAVTASRAAGGLAPAAHLPTGSSEGGA